MNEKDSWLVEAEEEVSGFGNAARCVTDHQAEKEKEGPFD